MVSIIETFFQPSTESPITRVYRSSEQCLFAQARKLLNWVEFTMLMITWTLQLLFFMHSRTFGFSSLVSSYMYLPFIWQPEMHLSEAVALRTISFAASVSFAQCLFVQFVNRNPCLWNERKVDKKSALIYKKDFNKFSLAKELTSNQNFQLSQQISWLPEIRRPARQSCSFSGLSVFVPKKTSEFLRNQIQIGW